ncbi:glyoxalase [Streptomyces echinoruber]|uniref:Glyoxalase n=2 Tax=Streptomyces echinoruber TaxID=68898 RepID=A0A918RJ37_9ACTN|nr:glyoxalase [Streptomyces echinoruber]
MRGEDEPNAAIRLRRMVHVLSSRVLLRPTDPERSRVFYGERLGLAVHREFGTGPERGTVYFLGGGFLEVSGRSDTPPSPALRLWLQVEDVTAAHEELRAKGVEIVRPPVKEPWGLIEMWIADPDGTQIVLVEVPADHPLRYRPGI